MSALPDTVAAREWLAQADTDPEHAYTWWDANPDGYAIIELGRLFDAVELTSTVAARVLGRPGTDGPVIRDDISGRAYVLVPPGTMDAWNQRLGLCLGATSWLRIPAVTRCTQPGLYWLVAPDGSGCLNDPEALAAELAEVAR